MGTSFQRVIIRPNICLILLLIAFFVFGPPGPLHSQIHNWTAINIGYKLENGEVRFIVTPKCIYYFNGNYSTIIRSKDQGATWDSVYVPSDSSHHEYVDMCFVNDSVGYLAGSDGSHFLPNSDITMVVKKTVDRGQTWQKVSNGIVDSCLLTHINFFDLNHGLVFGTGNVKAHRFITSTGGQNWNYVQNTGTVAQIDIHIPQFSSFVGNHGFVAGFRINGVCKLAQSHDGGQTWSTHQMASTNPSGLKFFSGTDGVIVSEDTLLVTNDAGATVSKRVFPYTNHIRTFDMIDMQKGFFCDATNIYYTADAGNTWSLSYSGTDQIIALRINGNNVYAATINAKTVLKLDISSIVGIGAHFAGGSGVKVFPNPARDRLHVSLPGIDRNALARIFDPLGKLMIQAGLSENGTLDVSMLPPGVYFLTIFTANVNHRERIVVSAP
jgi:photosystem II stability/assembly factor-like uncharacterized protein